MSFLRAALVAPALLLVRSALGQLTAPGCQTGWEWSFNTLGQDPCTVVAYLESTCFGGTFSIPALTPGHHYTGPSDAQDGNPCSCNSVSYNLISACDACQGSVWTQWSEWSLNCTQVAPAGTYPFNIPAGTRVPHWAYLDTTKNDTWNNFTAFATGDSPESTATALPSTATSGQSSATSTSAGTGGAGPGSSPGAQSGGATTTGHHSSHAGAIAGGVVGGIVGLALLAGIAAWLVRRNRQNRKAPGEDAHGDMAQAGFSSFSPTAPETPQKYYVRDSDSCGLGVHISGQMVRW
ncbi:hypothetical protein FA95DRAFT_1679988 [Auriscalpium vulgare]|uniref:Uncharacterized protein n=1 Tax=Auriscalpium vulgare TaxID=40419 RepID=A0ACB8RQF7_9AGAM|nr:hypothetical protein FA95DRAFT_1679988 [Auriscalpium vulgare]